MKSLKSEAVKTARKYGIKRFEKTEIVMALEEAGFMVLEERDNKARYESVAKALGIELQNNNGCCLYNSETARFVFVPAKIKEEEIPFELSMILFHAVFGVYGNGLQKMNHYEITKARSFAVHLEEACSVKGIRRFFFRYKYEAVSLGIVSAVILIAFSFLFSLDCLLDSKNENMLQYAKPVSVMENSEPTDAAANSRGKEDKSVKAVNKAVPSVKKSYASVVDNTGTAADVGEIVYYVTANGKKYHVEGCSYISDISVCTGYSEETIKDTDYEPCKRCCKE